MKLRKLKKTRTWYASEMSKTYTRVFLFSSMFTGRGSKLAKVIVYMPKL